MQRFKWNRQNYGGNEDAVFTHNDTDNYDYSNFINWDESTRGIMRVINIEIESPQSTRRLKMMKR